MSTGGQYQTHMHFWAMYKPKSRLFLNFSKVWPENTILKLILINLFAFLI